ncbi:DUF3883 domain-containing protein [Phycicoccus sp. CSK15P-2]|uniref:DUF3883 domain-containing protein n=1 Tax=Phycicoccus sp. CSK15P-2 TaxID=2807627 RepID=UPI0019524B32|nr:DUF3883 domain-containing protein [Phycicoccus sp. CSK15P-2]MBM6403522.1 DUF3883 domain-containing protein [Phycicoccus sp. CSK15P-2]
MPLIFGTEAPTLWDSDYADITGVQYEFPDRYRASVRPGERFIYYRGSRSGANGYFGEGVVGQIRSSAKPEHLIAAVHDVVLFEELVPIKDDRGSYLETGSTKGTNWANGVRRISDETFERIVESASPTPPDDAPTSSVGWASPEHAQKVERYSVEVVMGLLAAEFGNKAVREMPPGNPGYDIEVLGHDGTLHVEVKGTVLPGPVFHLSAGQRRHAELLGDDFRLVVVYAINVAAKTHAVTSCRGDELALQARLEPASWSGVLLA